MGGIVTMITQALYESQMKIEEQRGRRSSEYSEETN
jgi:hypothetical protein